MTSTLEVFTLTNEEMDTIWRELSQAHRANPQFSFTKKKLQRNAGESDAHFHNRLVYSYLVSMAMREIGQLPNTPWDEWYLGRIIHDHHLFKAYQHATKVSGFYPPLYFSTDEIAEKYFNGICQRAAGFALENFDRDTYTMMQANGRRAGLVTTYGLEHFLETREMNVSEASRHLKCDRKTVRALRKRFENYEEEPMTVDMETGEVMDTPDDYKDVVRATAKQRHYILMLERQLDEPSSEVAQMTLREAGIRITYLKSLRDAKALLEATEWSTQALQDMDHLN